MLASTRAARQAQRRSLSVGTPLFACRAVKSPLHCRYIAVTLATLCAAPSAAACRLDSRPPQLSAGAPSLQVSLEEVCSYVDQVLEKKGHVVIAVAEGAGQEHVATGQKDASGHTVYGDIGIFLRDHLNAQ